MTETLFTAHYSTPDLDLGSSNLGLVRVHSELRPPESIAWFCPLCGEIWARREVKDRFGKHPYAWITYIRVCQSCVRGCYQSKLFPAGSLIRTCSDSELDDLPEPVLKRELDILLKLLDN